MVRFKLRKAGNIKEVPLKSQQSKYSYEAQRIPKQRLLNY
jgi:hypothetical protein